MATVIIIGGPSGTGKSTISALISQALNCPFVEGDDLHPQANVDKMSRGQPLTDEDRWGWLQTLSHVCSEKATSAENSVHTAVGSCSMLKKVYREFLSQNGANGVQFKFVFLYTTFDELMQRVSLRQQHFMKADMVKSQYDIMEVPEGAELKENGGAAIVVQTTGKSPEEISQEILAALK